MKFFEDILKNRLKDATSREGVDADNLWAGIANALPEDKPVQKFRNLWVLLPLLFVGGGALWFYISDIGNDDLQANESHIVVYDEPETAIENKKLKEDKETTILKEENNLNNQKKTDIQANSPEEKTASQSILIEKSASEKSEIFVRDVQTIASFDNNSEILSPLKTTIENTDKKTSLTPNNQDITTSKPINTSPESLTFRTTNLLKSKPLFINQNEREKDLSDLALPINPFLKTQKKKKKLQLTIGAYSGINTMKNLFENTAKGDLLQNAYKLRAGYSAGAEVQFTLRNNLSFSTGLEYSKTMTQFNFVQETEGFIDNPNTVEVDEVRAKFERTVKHHNRLDFLTVPFVVSTSKTFGKFDLGIGAGVGFNIPTSQQGKTINAQDEIDEYWMPDVTSTPVPYQKFISYHLRPSINFIATEKLNFQIHPEFRYSLHKDEIWHFFGLKHSSVIGRLSLGLKYKL